MWDQMWLPSNIVDLITSKTTKMIRLSLRESLAILCLSDLRRVYYGCGVKGYVLEACQTVARAPCGVGSCTKPMIYALLGAAKSLEIWVIFHLLYNFVIVQTWSCCRGVYSLQCQKYSRHSTVEPDAQHWNQVPRSTQNQTRQVHPV